MHNRVKCSEESLFRGEGRAAKIDSTHEAQPSEIFISMQTTSKVVIISFKTLAFLVIHSLISSLNCNIEDNLCWGVELLALILKQSRSHFLSESKNLHSQ